MVEVLEYDQVVQQGPDKVWDQFEATAIVFKHWPKRFLFRTSNRCGKSPKLAAAAAAAAAADVHKDKEPRERQLAHGVVDGPALEINPAEAFPKFDFTNSLGCPRKRQMKAEVAARRKNNKSTSVAPQASQDPTEPFPMA